MKPLSERFRDFRRPNTQPVSRVSYGLAAEIGTDRYPRLEDAVAKTRRRILEWIGEQTNVSALGRRSLTEPFDEPNLPGVKLGVAIAPDGTDWVAKMERPDAEVPQRTWMTEVSVILRDGIALFGLRNTCSAPGESLIVPRSVPRLVKTIAKIVSLYDADEPIEGTPWVIESEQDVDDLFALVTSPDRFLPVVLVSQPYALDTRELARRLYGAAHVIAMSDDFTQYWAQQIGRRFNAYLGAVRTYFPGVDPETSDPFQHPLALRGRINSFSAGSETGTDAYVEFLNESIYASNARRIITDTRFPRYTEVSALALDVKRAAALSAHSPVAAEQYAREEIDQYKKQAEEARQLEAAALEENATFNMENVRLRSELFRMQLETDRMLRVLESAEKSEDVPIPDSVAELSEWLETYLPGRVTLLPRALREVKKSIYKSPEDIYQALFVLGAEYWRTKMGLGDNAAVESRLSPMGMEIGISVTQTFADESYYVAYGPSNSKRFLDRAVKKGTVHDPRETMRIYFFWDDDLKMVVVGSLPEHLDNSKT